MRRTLAMALLAFLVAVAAARPALAKDTVERSGDVLRWALPAAAAGLSWFRDDGEGLLRLGLSFGLAMGATQGLKAAIKSRRPNGQDNNSFPSGHVTNAFSAASYLDHRYGPGYGLPAYGLATWVAFSRVDADKHRIRDVAAAAVLAWGIDRMITPRWRKNLRAGGEFRGDGAVLRLALAW